MLHIHILYAALALSAKSVSCVFRISGIFIIWRVSNAMSQAFRFACLHPYCVPLKCLHDCLEIVALREKYKELKRIIEGKSPYACREKHHVQIHGPNFEKTAQFYL